MNIAKKEKVISSVIWKFLERLGIQGIQFVLQLILARLLSPEDYGILAILLVFINIANVFVQKGFAASLIQKQTVDNKDISSAFFMSLISAVIFYVILFVTAPGIAKFYGNTKIGLYLRILGISIFFASLSSVQNAVVARELLFKKVFSISMVTVLVSGLIGVICAVNGKGIWSLIFQQLSYHILFCFLLFHFVTWNPRNGCSFNSIKWQFNYGSKLFASSLLNSLYSNIRSLLVGKTFSAEELGFLTRGEQFPKLLTDNVDGSLQAVLFPVYSSEQNSREYLTRLIRKTIRISAYLVFPCLIGLACVAEELVTIVLTEKWIACVPFMQILCFEYLLYPIHTANLQAVNAIGRSDIFLKLEVIKKILSICVLIFSSRFGVLGIAYGSVFLSILSSFINAYPNKENLNYRYYDQIKDVIPFAFYAFAMGMIVNTISFFDFNVYARFLLKIILGVISYIAISVIVKCEEFYFVLKLIKKYWKK